jgi:hypothetical protein
MTLSSRKEQKGVVAEQFDSIRHLGERREGNSYLGSN